MGAPHGDGVSLPAVGPHSVPIDAYPVAKYEGRSAKTLRAVRVIPVSTAQMSCLPEKYKHGKRLASTGVSMGLQIGLTGDPSFTDSTPSVLSREASVADLLPGQVCSFRFRARNRTA